MCTGVAWVFRAYVLYPSLIHGVVKFGGAGIFYNINITTMPSNAKAKNFYINKLNFEKDKSSGCEDSLIKKDKIDSPRANLNSGG